MKRTELICFFGNRARYESCLLQFQFENIEIVYASSEKDIQIQAKAATAIWVELGIFVDRNLLEQFPSLRHVITSTTGVSHIDVSYLQERNIRLISLQDFPEITKKITSTSELTWLLVMALWRKLGLNQVHSKPSFQAIAARREENLGRQLIDYSIGIVGFGRIGRSICEYASVFGMRVGWFDPHKEESGAHNERITRYTDLQRLVTTSDIIVIAASLNKESTNLFDRQLLSCMKKDAVIVNTGRASLWDECAVSHLLTSGKIGGVGVDVYSFEENINQECSCLFDIDSSIFNIIRTAHIGGATHDALNYVTLEMCIRINRLFID